MRCWSRATLLSMLGIRKYESADWPQVWRILQAIIQAGDTFAFAPDTTEAEMRQLWVEMPTATFVATDGDRRILGTYFIKPNQPGLGSHVSNCGYAVEEHARGQGVASAMCEHSQAEAVKMGFRAMQFNIVVATNERAVRLWQRLGFDTVGRLPAAFKHLSLGYVDALVMFKPLVSTEVPSTR